MVTVLTVLWAHSQEMKQVFYVTLFPVVIITWMIERFCVLQDEDGFRTALMALLGTVCVAVAGYFIIINPYLKSLLFSYPELLLGAVACLLVLGRYKGMRLTEISRFWQMAAGKKRQNEKSA